MYQHILLPTDGSELSQRAVNLGVAFAREIGAKVTGLHAARHFYHLVDHYGEISAETLATYDENAKEQAKGIIKFAEDTAKSAKVPFEGLTVMSESPYEAIIDTAEKQGCDLIFMASHGRRGLQGLLLGSETLKVLTHCKIPVLVCR
jgi:nucleotide-binding universal stress UspA family protein